MDLTGIVGTIGLITLVWKFIDFLKQLTPPDHDYNAAITQVVVWVAGLVAVFLYAASELGDGITVGTSSLSNADFATKVICGLMIGSIASASVDVKQALDGSDSAKKPPLIGPPGP